MNRLLQLAAVIDQHLHQFDAVDLRREPSPWDCSTSAPSGPGLYISRVKDKGIMNLPTTGKAIVDYRVKNRNIDETSVDGEPRYGADIEVFSIQSYEEEEAEEGEEPEEEEGEEPEEEEGEEGEEETGLRALENFINFDGGYSDANVKKVYDRSKNKIQERVVLEKEPGAKARLKRQAGLVAGSGAGALIGGIISKRSGGKVSRGVVNGLLTGVTAGSLIDGHRAKNQASELLKKKGAIVGESYEGGGDPRLTHYSALERLVSLATRDRNEEGQFAPGSSVSPSDFRAASAVTKKKVAIGAGGLLAAGGAAAALSPQIRDSVGRAGKSVLASAGRMLMRR